MTEYKFIKYLPDEAGEILEAHIAEGWLLDSWHPASDKYIKVLALLVRNEASKDMVGE